MRLKLNTSKTELIWFDRQPKPHASKTVDMNIHIDANCVLHPADVVRHLGVLLDSQLSMNNHIIATTSACYFHLRRIRQVKRSLNEHCLRILVQALVISRLDYCNSILTDLPDSTLQPLTKVLHAAARLVNDIGYRDHLTPATKELHWLPIRARISFKINLLMFNIYSGSSPLYMASLVSPCATSISRRSLRSATKGDFITPRSNLQFGNRSFSLAGPAEWNRLPEIVRHSTSSAQFKSRLKSHVFSLYYD